MGDYRDFGQQDDSQADDGDARFVGVNARLSPEQLGPGMLADAKNVRLRSGTPETRAGLVKPGWLNVTRAGVDQRILPVSQPNGVGNFKDPNGLEWVLLAADGYIYRCRENNERFALPLPSGVKLLGTCVPVQAFNRVYLFRGIHLQPLVMTSIATGFADLVARWSSSTVYQAAVLANSTLADEVAYGPFQAVSTLTSSGGTATVVTAAEHGYVTGADVVIKGANQAEYNGRWNITVVDLNTFTYAFAGSGTPTATGTIKVSNMALYWKALGSKVTLTSLTSSSTTATATKTAHGFTTGQYVTIAGATPAAYNGTYVITVTDADHFTYTFAGGTSPATGVITAQTSVTLAGQSPDTNPEAWQQIYTVLPNADDALFIDNRLLVPTAYTPGDATYDSTTVYTKKDFIVAMEIGDDVHFFFTNELRINQGSADEIVSLVKFDADTVVVIKGLSWGILTGLAGGDLSTVKLDMRQGYGTCAPRAAIAAGRNVLFPSTQRGICSLMQSEQGQTRSVDIPLSNDLDRVVRLIDWRLANKIRLAWWDDKLYCAVPLKDGVVRGLNLVPAGAVYTATPGGFYKYEITNLLTAGQTYVYAPGANEAQLFIIYPGFGVTRTITKPGTFVFDGVQAFLYHSTTPVGMSGPFPPIAVTGSVAAAGLANCNNAILVYDFRSTSDGPVYPGLAQPGEWNGYDTGSALCVKEFFIATSGGRDRLFFLAEDGYVNLMEEAAGADQVGDYAQTNGLSWENIATSIDSRGYDADRMSSDWFKSVDIGLAMWNASFSVLALVPAANVTKAVRTALSFSRTQYLKPVGKADYVQDNSRGDFATPGRGEYSVQLLSSGVAPGFSGDQFQEVTVKTSLRPLQGRYAQIRVTSSQGRLRLKSIGASIGPGMRREGISV
jgi:hypothetical protein